MIMHQDPIHIIYFKIFDPYYTRYSTSNPSKGRDKFTCTFSELKYDRSDPNWQTLIAVGVHKYTWEDIIS
ncbi:MAG: hypothetical protein RR483_00685 [Clostridia bacterium]